ncbi:RNA polymerase sigma factor [Desertivirga brevis]|uniref:RNA polymerase sigma factor n=1 Tax=Desertivirga brevis TaxID=2810310 RepID=UPI001A964B7F|nr:RNA polymerase sigma-70 factor [Pedobacter sp. SYSU D00873]
MLKYKNLSDKEIFEQLKKADRTAFSEIYERYWGILFRHARRMLQDDNEAKDLVQDVFATLWAGAPEITLTSSLSAYLYASVRNKVFNLIERGKVKQNYQASLENFILAGEYTTDNAILEKELARRIEAEIKLLPPKMREVFELSRKHHLSYREIAWELKISENTVKKQINKALTSLRLKISVIITAVFFLF